MSGFGPRPKAEVANALGWEGGVKRGRPHGVLLLPEEPPGPRVLPPASLTVDLPITGEASSPQLLLP